MGEMKVFKDLLELTTYMTSDEVPGDVSRQVGAWVNSLITSGMHEYMYKFQHRDGILDLHATTMDGSEFYLFRKMYG